MEYIEKGVIIEAKDEAKDAVQEKRWPRVIVVWEWLNRGGAKLQCSEVSSANSI